MTDELTLAAEPMTADSFAPFGDVWEATEQPADRRLMTPTGYSHDGRTTVSVIWQPQAGLGFHVLERHFGVTQSFVQLSGAPAVVCAAPPTASDDPADVPDPASVRCFRIDPGKGWSFRRGTWHSLNRFVLGPPGGTFLILNSAPNPTQMVDYAAGKATVYRDLGADEEPESLTLPDLPRVSFRVAAGT
ncbi:Ureidoglycolate hydrolase (allantoin degradation) [Tistlia consotensis]|uniref:Ureidoglycolate hydrolase (Allantoin degradation) n=1 Tax=Tistlia consotensis USBA 355 TaxID=560819 RepID=A0A1Y6CIL0_9PROT|nr:ureidoglycolate lyase [Tistlia consotensis]SMF64456.1 Ureidoglycolate hydrolase (allantoin degradation) [Tistlia consotensis USBA 355]SNR97468.1 Ureidoglycolate hydrolase (allantoin degradation) [Tistlia consotensis]